MKYAFVEKNRRQYGVPALCEALQVSRSGYYAARHRGPSNRQQRQVDLTARIRTIRQASREWYGAPRYMSSCWLRRCHAAGIPWPS